jgi:hypothetical protein
MLSLLSFLLGSCIANMQFSATALLTSALLSTADARFVMYADEWVFLRRTSRRPTDR